MTRIALPQVVERLRSYYGEQKPPEPAGAWEMILWENVAYLADDARRGRAFQTLRDVVGTEPRRILGASDEALLEATGHGILAERFADKLRRCAELALDEFDGDLRPVLLLPLAKARKALQRFPGIGAPGAEKILLFTRTHAVPALESNGVRVLARLEFGEEKKSYSTTYRLVTSSLGEQLGGDCALLIRAHLLLRRHGQELCRRSGPDCGRCPLAAGCEHFRRERA
jgi:endonuclease-3